MSVLLLCYGDPEAKNLLRQAIEARYGASPPVLESLKILFEGRTKAKVGPISAWVPVNASAYFVFPTLLRWDFTVRPLGLPVQRGIEAFDGDSYRSLRGNGEPTILSDIAYIESIRRRLWAIAATLLTPLSDVYIKVSMCGENCIQAENTQLKDSARLYFRPDKSLSHVEVQCLNPETERIEQMRLQISEEQQIVSGMMMPTKISTYWDDQMTLEMKPSQLEINPAVSTALFTIAKNTAYI